MNADGRSSEGQVDGGILHGGVFQTVGGDQSLTQAEAAVAGRDFGVEIDCEGFGAQAIQHQLK